MYKVESVFAISLRFSQTVFGVCIPVIPVLLLLSLYASSLSICTSFALACTVKT